MPQYLVKGATQKKVLNDGANQVIALVLQEYGQENQISAEWYTNGNSPLPEIGSTQEFEVTQGKFGLDARRPRTGGRGGGGWKPKPPEERRSIAMQHAQKCAVTLLELAAQHGDYKPPNAGDAVEQVKSVAWVLFRQVQAAETQDREQS